MGTSRRRQFLVAAGAVLAAPSIARAQARMARVGILIASDEASTRHLMQAFTKRLAELGWADGTNIQYLVRYSGSRSENDEANARDLVSQRVDLIFAPFEPVAVTAKKHAGALPIVFCIAPDPVEAGLVASLARPGGNATGVTTQSNDLYQKRLQLLKETVPFVKGIGIPVLRVSQDHPLTLRLLSEARKGASKLGMSVVVSYIGASDDFGPILSGFQKEGAQAVLGTLQQLARRQEFADALLKARLPSVHVAIDLADAGGLLSLAVSFTERFRAAADYVSRILRGAPPADMPVEEPTRFELVVNLKTARLLGIKVPQTILMRTDRVIE